ncbi:hypothetical protein ACO1O0_008887 [Amphichorda felina]
MSSPTVPIRPSSPPSSQSHPAPSRHHQRAVSDIPSIPARAALGSRTSAFPFSFIRPFQPNPSSTSLVPSTAEGKPIPVDDSTVESRTSALRELNNNYPSRHRYERSTGAQSSTYSEPVIVRSYYSPLPSRPISTSRGGVIVHGGAGTVSQSGSSVTAERRSLSFATTVTTARNGMLSRMGRARDTKRFGTGGPEELPPVEAFTFKSFIANMEHQEGGSDINADLDRIAEICARSRYSLSNQYEVHYAPHGSGASFMGGSRGYDIQGPTLQVVSSDDERSMRRLRKRRNGARRNSRAMGTLETIMSSSRSSDEDRSGKKSAAEIAEEIRGRATRKESGNTTPTTSSRSMADDQFSLNGQDALKTPTGRRSASLALIDGSKQNLAPGDPASPRNSATSLVGEPALPKASTSQLEIRTAREEERTKEKHAPPVPTRTIRARTVDITIAKGAISSSDRGPAPNGFISTLSGWIPWRSPDTASRSPGRAEGSLRQLLRTTDIKGKGVEREFA